MRWVDLLRDDPARLEVELAKAGTSAIYLVRDAFDVPELRDVMRRLRTDEARLRLALEWFGDGGHPQPTKRTRPALLVTEGRPAVLGKVTPEWGQLPKLDDDEPAEGQQGRRRIPRQRPPQAIASSVVQQLKGELEQRRADPGDREFTQARIAGRLRLAVTRVQQAERLERLGWDLLRSDPDFLVDDGFVRWPSDRKAALLLAADEK
jgi:hypothetical protein